MDKRKQTGGLAVGRFFRWMKSELPDSAEDKPVLLLGVTKISESPACTRRKISEGSGNRCYRFPKSKYQRGHKNDERLERIRRDLSTHKSSCLDDNDVEVELRRHENDARKKRTVKCLTLSCVGQYDTARSYRDSFVFQRPEEFAQISGNAVIDFSESFIEHSFSDPEERPQNCVYANIGLESEDTPKLEDRKPCLLSNLNERLRKTLSLDNRKVNSVKSDRPKSLASDGISASPKSYRSDDAILEKTKKKRRFRPKSLFNIETLFDSKRSDSSAEDHCSSKYKKFELDLDDSPLLGKRERTPDLLVAPFITESLRRKTASSHKEQLDKLEFYYNAHRKPQVEDETIEYIEPIGSLETGSTLTLHSRNIPAYKTLKADSILNLDDLSKTDYEVEVKRTDSERKRIKDLVVKIMDKSIDSIGSCSLDVDASTEYSDTTSGSLNLLTPSSTTSRVRDFTTKLQERATPCDKKPPPKFVVSDAASQRSSRSQKKPSYLNLACSVNGYTNLTTYDSKLRKDINKSREASPVRPITFRDNLVVPVPISADKLLVTELRTDDCRRHLTQKAPSQALNNHYLETSPVLVYMAAENKQMKRDFMASNMASRITQSKTNDEVDNVVTFKSSYSETNITGKKYTATNGQTKISTVVNGVTKRYELTTDGSDKLASPIKSFIQQRVERLYGPGALAQGFFNQKRLHSKSEVFSNESFVTKADYTKDVNGCESLPVLRHLRPEFRAQLPIVSPKKTSPCKSGPKENVIKIEIASNGVCEESNGAVDEVKTNGVCEKDGHYFLELKRKETERLIELALSAEKELNELQDQKADVSEEVFGFLRSAAGKARLLATQKMQQFEGLCYNNINRSPDEQFPTTNQDLQGFWDMVMLQVSNVDALYREVADLKSNGWKELTPKVDDATPAQRRSTSSRPSSGRKSDGKSPASGGAVSEKARKAAEKRESDRKAMLEQRRKLAKEKQNAVTNGNTRSNGLTDEKEVEIFVGKQAVSTS